MISKRLLQISKFIDSNKVVYDVGSDHAYLPCFLVSNSISPKAYAVDNKEGPLNKAKQTIKSFNLEDKVIPILSNGIDDIRNDVDIIVLSGMGFYTVKDILDKKDLSRYSKIIVQVNKDTNLLRSWISDNNYSIIDEAVVYDDFYYEIVVFNASKSNKLNDLEIKYGPINLKNKDDTFIEYLKYKKAKYESINKASNSTLYAKDICEINDII